MSWAARGLLVFLLGKPDHWKVSVAALVNETASSAKATGRDAVYSLLQELIDAGYIGKRQGRGSAGEFGRTDYIVTEIPAPLPDSPLPDLPDTVNPTQVSIEETKQGLRKNLSAEADLLPDWLPADLWKNYIGHCDDIGKRLSPSGQQKALAALAKLRNHGHDPEAVIEQSVMSGGRHLLPVNNRGQAAQPIPTASPATKGHPGPTVSFL